MSSVQPSLRPTYEAPGVPPSTPPAKEKTVYPFLDGENNDKPKKIDPYKKP